MKCDVPVFARRVVLQLVFDHANHDVVADEPTRVHNFLRLHAKSGLLDDLFAKHITGGEVAYAEGLSDTGCLCTLS